mmetsp:Transcript_32448/g.52585  ORF Transcript_32448/g.52585 Transcript_32448/m.52585 type:complete len:211 (-) Transcript_32448:122-754(-)
MPWHQSHQTAYESRYSSSFLAHHHHQISIHTLTTAPIAVVDDAPAAAPLLRHHIRRHHLLPPPHAAHTRHESLPYQSRKHRHHYSRVQHSISSSLSASIVPPRYALRDPPAKTAHRPVCRTHSTRNDRPYTASAVSAAMHRQQQQQPRWESHMQSHQTQATAIATRIACHQTLRRSRHFSDTPLQHAQLISIYACPCFYVSASSSIAHWH